MTSSTVTLDDRLLLLEHFVTGYVTAALDHLGRELDTIGIPTTLRDFNELIGACCPAR